MGADGSWITEFPYTVVQSLQLPVNWLPTDVRHRYPYTEIRFTTCDSRGITIIIIK